MDPVVRRQGLSKISVYISSRWNMHHSHASNAWCASQRVRFCSSSFSVRRIFWISLDPFTNSDRPRVFGYGYSPSAVRPANASVVHDRTGKRSGRKNFAILFSSYSARKRVLGGIYSPKTLLMSATSSTGGGILYSRP